MRPVTPPPRPRLLIAEDDPLARRKLQMLLSGRGMEVRAYGCGRDVLSDPLTRDARALLSADSMPDVDGLELIAALRASGWPGRAIMIADLAPRATLADQALAAGFEAVLERPFSDTALLAAVDRLMA